MAYDVQAAMERIPLPAYRSALRRGDMEAEPDSYVVYAIGETPIDFFDDQPNGMILRPFLHLCTRSDPLLLIGKIEEEMEKEGFALTNRQDAYDEDADLYITQTEWQGVKRDGI